MPAEFKDTFGRKITDGLHSVADTLSQFLGGEVVPGFLWRGVVA
jgi:hypothetical protein